MAALRIEVAVGVVFDSTGKVLVAHRPVHLPQGGCWEFPGGKVESGETVIDALKRELFEEVGIIVTHNEPWLIIDHDYPDKSVRLNVHKVTGFEGIAKGCLGQELLWLSPKEILTLAVPIANQEILQALNC